jgi:hypothetical protein
MRVRDRLSGTILSAELELQPLGKCHSEFVLIIRDSRGHQEAMGRLTTALEYELVEASPQERAALILAGFPLPRADEKRHRLARLLRILQSARRRKRAIGRPNRLSRPTDRFENPVKTDVASPRNHHPARKRKEPAPNFPVLSARFHPVKKQRPTSSKAY